MFSSVKVKARGVDSVGQGFADPVSFVKNLALKESWCLCVSSTLYI